MPNARRRFLARLRLPGYHFVYASGATLSTGLFRCCGSEKPLHDTGSGEPGIVETSEFEKAGGSCFCMKMFLP